MCVHWIFMEADLSDNQKYPSLNTFCIVFKHCDIRLQCSGIKCVLNHANHASSHSKLGFECGKCALNTLEKIQFKQTLMFFCSMSTTLLNCSSIVMMYIFTFVRAIVTAASWPRKGHLLERCLHVPNRRRVSGDGQTK